jgi:hypothetical protein
VDDTALRKGFTWVKETAGIGGSQWTGQHYAFIPLQIEVNCEESSGYGSTVCRSWLILRDEETWFDGGGDIKTVES